MVNLATHNQNESPTSLLKTAVTRTGQLSTNTISRIVHKASQVIDSYKDTTQPDNAASWAKIGTLGSILGLAFSLAPGLPEQIKPWQAPTGLAISTVCLNSTRKHTKTAVRAKELKRLTQVEQHERAKLNIETTYRPWDAPNLIKVGGEARSVANVLNTDPNSLQVEAFGEKVWGTFKRYYFGVVYKDDRADLFNWKPMIRETLATTEAVTLEWSEGRLCVDVSKPKRECAYPKVSEQLGSDRHQILIPLGMNGDKLLTIPLDSQFNGGWITGMSGSGKSYSVIGILDFLRRRHSARVIQYSVAEMLMGSKTRSFKDSDWADDPHLYAPIATGFVGLIQTLAKIIYECRERAKKFNEVGAEDFEDWNNSGYDWLPRILYFIDEPEQIFDPEICPYIYQAAILRMLLIIGRMCRSQGAAVVFMPKSVAAGEKDLFPVGLRRTMGTFAMCLKALASDGCITLQATEKEEGFASEVAHLPGRGAGLTRHNSEIVRVQTLYADKLDKNAIVGYGRDSQADQTLPSFIDVMAEFSSPNAMVDEDLVAILEEEGISFNELKLILKGELTPEQARTGDKEVKKQTENIEAVSEEEYERLYRSYKNLRRSMSMTDAILQMSGASGNNRVAFKKTQRLVEEAVLKYLPEWVSELPEDLSSDVVATQIFGNRTGKDAKAQKDKLRRHVENARKYLEQGKVSERN